MNNVTPGLNTVEEMYAFVRIQQFNFNEVLKVKETKLSEMRARIKLMKKAATIK